MPPPPPPRARSAAERRQLVTTVTVVALALAIPIGISLGLSWYGIHDGSARAGPAPEWLALPALRASTSDGSVLRTKISLDVEDESVRTALQQSSEQVSLLLAMSVNAMSRAQLARPGGLRALASDMQARLNEYVTGGESAPVRSVAIEDLVVNPP